MTVTTIVTVIGGIVIIIGAAARLPSAVAELVRACIPVIDAIDELRSALNTDPRPTDGAELRGTSDPDV